VKQKRRRRAAQGTTGARRLPTEHPRPAVTCSGGALPCPLPPAGSQVQTGSSGHIPSPRHAFPPASSRRREAEPQPTRPVPDHECPPPTYPRRARLRRRRALGTTPRASCRPPPTSHRFLPRARASARRKRTKPPGRREAALVSIVAPHPRISQPRLPHSTITPGGRWGTRPGASPRHQQAKQTHNQCFKSPANTFSAAVMMFSGL